MNKPSTQRANTAGYRGEVTNTNAFASSKVDAYISACLSLGFSCIPQDFATRGRIISVLLFALLECAHKKMLENLLNTFHRSALFDIRRTCGYTKCCNQSRLCPTFLFLWPTMVIIDKEYTSTLVYYCY